MPPTRLPFTYVIGGKYWRFRRGELKAALPGQPGDPAFHARYAELLALSERKAPEPDRESFNWLIDRYRKSAEFAALRPLTQLDYSNTLVRVRFRDGMVSEIAQACLWWMSPDQGRSLWIHRGRANDIVAYWIADPKLRARQARQRTNIRQTAQPYLGEVM